MTINLICSSIRIMSLGCLGFRRLFSVPPDGSRSVQTRDIEIRSRENQIEEVGSRPSHSLVIPSLLCGENCIVGVVRSRVFRFWLVCSSACASDFLPTSTICLHRIISDGVVNGIGRNGNVLILPTQLMTTLTILAGTIPITLRVGPPSATPTPSHR